MLGARGKVRTRSRPLNGVSTFRSFLPFAGGSRRLEYVLDTNCTVFVFVTYSSIT